MSSAAGALAIVDGPSCQRKAATFQCTDMVFCAADDDV